MLSEIFRAVAGEDGYERSCQFSGGQAFFEEGAQYSIGNRRESDFDSFSQLAGRSKSQPWSCLAGL
jgi:hypothetical protein